MTLAALAVFSRNPETTPPNRIRRGWPIKAAASLCDGQRARPEECDPLCHSIAHSLDSPSSRDAAKYLVFRNWPLDVDELKNLLRDEAVVEPIVESLCLDYL